MKKGYISNIEQETLQNPHFRKVLYTGKHSQLVLMTLQPGEDIGKEVHENIDQFFRIEQGEGEVFIDGIITAIKPEFAIIVPAGSEHNITNTGSEPMKLYSIYSPAEHKDGIIHETKEIAIERHLYEQFDGVTTE